MSFLPEVRAEIARRDHDDPMRITLEFLLENAVGRNNSISIPTVVRHLRENQISIDYKQFQQTLLAESRRSNFFIGSHGCPVKTGLRNC